MQIMRMKESQMEKSMDHDMETGAIYIYIGVM